MSDQSRRKPFSRRAAETPRKPKQRYSGWSSCNDEPEGKETIEAIGKLMPLLLFELLDAKTVFPEEGEATKKVEKEIGEMKRHLLIYPVGISTSQY